MLFPQFFRFHHVLELLDKRRYHRSHISHMRQDRLRRLVKHNYYTIFVLGAGGRSVPIGAYNI
jgi:hypothetical protein